MEDWENQVELYVSNIFHPKTLSKYIKHFIVQMYKGIFTQTKY